MLGNIAQPILRIDVVVAGVDAAVVLQGHPLAAKLSGDAVLGGHAHPLRHGRLEQIDQHPPQVFAMPLVEDLAEERRQSRPDRRTSR